ncbi:hypothetical protein CPB85DRAFT_1445466 [Mucidula mucida]|nr:hypothetical protein CPB85DRAFT_1445466 [Mucidula mucida]
MSATHGGTPKRNQHRPIPPQDELDKYIRYYWHLEQSDKDIASHVLDHFEEGMYGCSAKRVKRIRETLGLDSARKPSYTAANVVNVFQEIRNTYPTMGARQMVHEFRQSYNIKVTEKYIFQLMREYEPEALKARRAKHFRRRVYYGAGVMEVKIWWTNRNPILIGGYYFEAARSQGGVPLKTQGDPGSENNVLANVYTEIRQRLDPLLEGYLQHKICHRKQNIKPEITWSVIRHGFTPGFEEHLDTGVDAGLYNYADPMHRYLLVLVFRWLSIPWLQAKLDKWRTSFNSCRRRHSKHKVLPQEIPDLVHWKPGRYGYKDFTVPVSTALFDEMEEKWCPRNYYWRLGSPPVSIHTFWDIYSRLLAQFQAVPDNDLQLYIDSLETHEDVAFIKNIERLPGLGAGQEEIIALFKDAEQYRGYIDITDEEEGYIDVTDAIDGKGADRCNEVEVEWLGGGMAATQIP